MTSNRRLASVVLALISCLLLGAVTWLGLKEGEDLLIQRKYTEAAAALRAALPQAPAADRDRVLFLLGRAELLAGNHEAAAATFRRLIEESPASALASAASFQEAKALEAKGSVREAAQIYRDRIAALIGLERKQELAATYLGLAEQAKAKDPADHERVVTFCDLALDLGLTPQSAASVRLQAAQALQAQGKHKEAIERLTPLVAQLELGTGKVPAMLALGQCRRQVGDLAGARTVLRDLRTLAPQSPEAGDAAYEIALCYGVPRPIPALLDRAIHALEDLERDHAGHPQAKNAQYWIAQCYRSTGRGDDALAALARFLARAEAAGGDTVALARAMKGDIYLEQGKPELAIAAWREYLQKHPAHGEWERVQRAIVDAEFGQALLALRQGKEHFVEARRRLQTFADTYPLDERNPEVLRLLGDMLRQEEKYPEACEAFARCVSKYPGKEAASRAQFAIGEIYEQKTFDYEKALQAYRAVTWGSKQSDAAARIQRLLQKQLSLHTARVFRTDEEPKLELTSRNIEAVRVRVYRLDLEDYFRATHTASDVGRLDIEVITADQTFDSKVPDYVRYRETQREVALPFRAPGAYVVKVDDRELEATTLVLVSDIALITKSSRHEFFVFTQNTKENRPEGGVKVVLSDGKKVIAEGVTQSDGVFRFRGEDLKNCDQLAVFAVAAGGSGASTVDLSGMGYSPGLQAKAYIVTDRPLYQPGQRVQWKGIVREVQDGVYQLPQGKDYRVQIWSPSGRILQQRAVALSSFGSFAADFDLPAEAELGDWRIGIDREQDARTTYWGGFAVQKYERPRLSLRVDLTHPVVYRGEAIQGKLVAQWFYGEPAAGKEIRYSLAMGALGTVERSGVTNAAGEIAFSFPTQEIAEEAVLELHAAITGETAATAAVVQVATTEFTPQVTAMRSVYLAKERFEVEVLLRDRIGRAVARDIEVILLRLEAQSGRSDLVEREVARQNSKTASDGKVKVAFAAEEGGVYRIRAQAKDRFGNLNSGELQLGISGDEDQVRLRLLADRDMWQVGDTATLKVMNRAGARLALLTWQGDGILGYETRVLPAGESMLELPIQKEHAPNFALGIAMIDGNRLHTQERPFRVLRDLRVTVQAPAKARPGAKIDVAVEARDPQGKPVAAEVALSMVDQALLTLRADAQTAIGAFFYGDVRETAFRTSSSCTWVYDAKSHRVNAALLAEERAKAADRGAEPAYRGPGDMVPPQAASAVPAKNSTKDLRNFHAGLPVLQTAGGGKGATKAEAERNSLPSRDAEAEFLGLMPQRAAQTTELGDVSDIQLVDSLARLQDVDNASDGKKGRESAQYIALGTGGWDDRTVVRRFAANDEGDAPANLAAFAYGRIDLNGFGASYFGIDASQPRVDFRETGAWLPSILTDSDGRGTASITLPQSATAWALTARAVTADTWVGEGTASMATQQELQVDVAAPPILTEGDQTEIAVRVHNLTEATRTGTVNLKIQVGAAAPSEQARPIELAAHAEVEHAYPLSAGIDAIALAASVEAGDLRDSLRLSVPVQPFGAEHLDGRSGSTRDQAAFELGLPIGRDYGALRMLVELGPDPGRDLIAAATGAGYLPRSCVQVADTSLARASRGLGALVVLEYLERAGTGTKQDRAQLLSMAQGVLQALLQSQLQDGSQAWVGNKAQDLRSTCQFVRFLAAARRRGLGDVTAPLDRAAEWLLQALRTASPEARTDVLWALAAADRARFEALTTSHRARSSLSPDGLARLALAWQEHKRPELAIEAVESLRTALPAPQFGKQSVVTVALAARALLAADKRDALGTAALQYVQSARRGAAFGTAEATAAALQLLAFARNAEAGAARASEVTVRVNGNTLATQPREGSSLESVFVVPSDWLLPQGNRVQIAVSGGGEVAYSVSLLGFARGFRDEDRDLGKLRVTRDYLAAPRRFGDKDVPAGFDVVLGKDIPTWRNVVTKLRTGETARVEVRFAVRAESDRDAMMPLVLEEPIPAGCTVSRASIEGDLEQVEVLPGRLVFFVRQGVTDGVVRYDLQARFPGVYRALPSHCYAALRPELGGSGPVSSLTILNAGAAGELDPYRWTPAELFYLGKAEDDAAQGLQGEPRAAALARAAQHLEQLLTWQQRDYQLREDVAKEAVRRLLFLAIERGDSKAVVRCFEEIKERHADLVVPFEKILAVGKSYLDLGEFESALLVFRGTAEASFLKDAAVATTLEGLGETVAAARFLDRLLIAYPDLPTMRVTRYSLGQKLAAAAAAMDPARAIDDKVGSAAQLRARSLAVFREFLVMCPEDPLAEEVSFAWATTQLEAKDLAGALATATAALERYPSSPFQDELLYTQGYAQFALGQHDAAFAALQRVATEQFATDKGGRAESENKWNAIYLQGQIHHARGEASLALADYERVKDRFTDAREAADLFVQKSIALPEVTTCRLSQTPKLELSFRNIRTASLQVFQVDLMRLYLMEKSLNDIRGVQLHGIKPLLAQEIELGDGRDYRTKVKTIELPLSAPGAYLAVVRGGDQIASGMLLRSDLELETQEQADVGRLRVHVRRGESVQALAEIRVAGSGEGQVRSGETDLRGIWTGDGLVGAVTVVVKKDQEYAFFRGTTVHQPALLAPRNGQQQQQQSAGQAEKKANNFDALEGNVFFNSQNRDRQVQWLNDNVGTRKQKGVEVFRAK